MQGNAPIQRPHERRLVKWRSSTDSEPVDITGAAFNLYIPSTFAGTTITVYALVKRIINDSATGETDIDDYKEYANGTIDVSGGTDRIYDLTANQLFGLEKVKFKSSSSETCTGELLMAS